MSATRVPGGSFGAGARRAGVADQCDRPGLHAAVLRAWLPFRRRLLQPDTRQRSDKSQQSHKPQQLQQLQQAPFSRYGVSPAGKRHEETNLAAIIMTAGVGQHADLVHLSQIQSAVMAAVFAACRRLSRVKMCTGRTLHRSATAGRRDHALCLRRRGGGGRHGRWPCRPRHSGRPARRRTRWRLQHQRRCRPSTQLKQPSTAMRQRCSAQPEWRRAAAGAGWHQQLATACRHRHVHSGRAPAVHVRQARLRGARAHPSRPPTVSLSQTVSSQAGQNLTIVGHNCCSSYPCTPWAGR